MNKDNLSRQSLNKASNNVLKPYSWGKRTIDPNEIRFLKGPLKKGSELARLLRIFCEFLRGFHALHNTGPFRNT